MTKGKEAAKKAGGAVRRGARKAGGAVKSGAKTIGKEVAKIVPKTKVGRTAFVIICIVAASAISYSVYSALKPASSGNVTPTPPAPVWTFPSFYCQGVKLNPTYVWVMLFYENAKTGAWSAVANGEGASTILSGALLTAPNGVTVSEWFLYMSFVDDGNDKTTFGDGIARQGFVMGKQIYATGPNDFTFTQQPTYPDVQTTYASINMTVTAISAVNPLKATWVDASNLTVTITPSQATEDLLCGWPSWVDDPNATIVEPYYCIAGNWSTSVLGATYLKVYANGVQLTPTAVAGSTGLYYGLGAMSKDPIVLSAQWTGAAVAASAGIDGTGFEFAAGTAAGTEYLGSEIEGAGN